MVRKCLLCELTLPNQCVQFVIHGAWHQQLLIFFQNFTQHSYVLVILINILIDHLLGILNLGCYGIRIRRYVSNGFCTSRKAIRDTICDGRCLPMDELPFFPQFSKILSKRKKEWRCVPDYVKRRKVTVFCNDGTKRRYRIPVVRTCKCKRYMKKQNMTNPPGQLKKGSKSR